MTMDWDKLRIFYAVAQAGSFTGAGETLMLSQSAVSRQISSLEESLGLSLFHRHARGLLLTEQGELLFGTTQDIFAKLSMIEGQLMDSKELAEGPLTVTVAEFIGTTWLSSRLGDFHKLCPDINLRVILEDRILNLGMREADAAIRLYEPAQPELIQRQLTTIKFHLCASKDYLEKNGTPKKLQDLNDHVMLAFPQDVVAPFANTNWFLEETGIDSENHKKLIKINSISAIYKAVEYGCGISALPDYIIQRKEDIVPLFPDIKHDGVNMYFVYPQERKHSRRIALFRDFLLKHIEETSR